MELIYKDRPLFFVDEILSHFALPFYICTATNLSFPKHRDRIEWWQPSWIFWCSRTRKTDIKKISYASLTAKRWQCIVPYFTQILTNISLNLCNNSDQTWFSNTLTFARSRGRCWKPRPTTASVFNISLGTGQTLMHGKSCLIPIILGGWIFKNFNRESILVSAYCEWPGSITNCLLQRFFIAIYKESSMCKLLRKNPKWLRHCQ